MIRRILVPLDGSDVAESVLVKARQLSARQDAEFILLRVVTLPPTTEDDAGQPGDLLWSRATEYLQGLSRGLTSEGLHVRCKVIEGFPAQRILEIAAREQAKLIVMSTHGRSGIPRWVFGSVTEDVVRASPIPVVAVPSFAGADGGGSLRRPRERSFGTIVCPISAEELSLEILPALSEFARLFDSRVILVNAREEADSAVPMEQLRLAHQRLREAGVAAEPLLTTGEPAVRILGVAEDQGADLIAMTTHGRRGLSRWLLGSVAENVLRGSKVPLLVVRPSEKFHPASAHSATMPVEFHTDP